MDEKRRKTLVRELCARLPYGVQVRTAVKYKTLDIGLLDAIMGGRATFDILPLLRPMESMTDAERAEYNRAADRDLDRMADKVGRKLKGDEKLDETLTPYYEHIDWLLEHHFDYRGLIEMGLALEAPEGMYNIKG